MFGSRKEPSVSVTNQAAEAISVADLGTEVTFAFGESNIQLGGSQWARGKLVRIDQTSPPTDHVVFTLGRNHESWFPVDLAPTTCDGEQSYTLPGTTQVRVVKGAK